VPANIVPDFMKAYYFSLYHTICNSIASLRTNFHSIFIVLCPSSDSEFFERFVLRGLTLALIFPALIMPRQGYLQ